MIFAFVSSGKRKLEACLQLVLREIVQTGSVQGLVTPPLTAHTVRVGCVAALQRLDLSELRLKAWIGWQPSSQIW